MSRRGRDGAVANPNIGGAFGDRRPSCSVPTHLRRPDFPARYRAAASSVASSSRGGLRFNGIGADRVVPHAQCGRAYEPFATAGHRDRASRKAASHRGDRGAGRSCRRRDRAVRPHQGQGHAGGDGGASGRAGRRFGVGDGRHAHRGRRGQDHHDDRADAGTATPRAPGHQRHAGALAGSGVRRQGRRGRRRLCAGGADGGHQPALHRRLRGGERGAQPAGGHAGQPPAPGQRARYRCAARPLAAGDGHERPCAA